MTPIGDSARIRGNILAVLERLFPDAVEDVARRLRKGQLLRLRQATENVAGRQNCLGSAPVTANATWVGGGDRFGAPGGQLCEAVEQILAMALTAY